jgi:hypothetical protein
MAVDRWVVIDPDHANKTILDGPFKWDGVAQWTPPTAGELMLEADALAGGWQYPQPGEVAEDT